MTRLPVVTRRIDRPACGSPTCTNPACPFRILADQAQAEAAACPSVDDMLDRWIGPQPDPEGLADAILDGLRGAGLLPSVASAGDGPAQ